MEKAGLKILAIIPARGGSKGVPEKNIRLIAGKSLIQRTYEVACQSKYLDRVILSTDSEKIAAHANIIGLQAPFMRPPKLATDESPMIDTILFTLEKFKEKGYSPDAVMLLQPTSPLRQVKHIDGAIELLNDNDAVCSVIQVPPEMSPYYVMKITEQGYLDYFLPEGRLVKRRQDAPKAYKRDGTVYLATCETIYNFKNLYGNRCIPMEIDTKESLSIDTQDDWEKAEVILLSKTSMPNKAINFS